jgi:hypothetical protein
MPKASRLDVNCVQGTHTPLNLDEEEDTELAVATGESEDSENGLNLISFNDVTTNPKTQSKIIVTCYFEGSDKPFKALIDTGADINMVCNTMLKLSNGKTTRKASAIQTDGSEIKNLSRTEQKHIVTVEDSHGARISSAQTFYLTDKCNDNCILGLPWL